MKTICIIIITFTSFVSFGQITVAELLHIDSIVGGNDSEFKVYAKKAGYKLAKTISDENGTFIESIKSTGVQKRKLSYSNTDAGELISYATTDYNEILKLITELKNKGYLLSKTVYYNKNKNDIYRVVNRNEWYSDLPFEITTFHRVSKNQQIEYEISVGYAIQD